MVAMSSRKCLVHPFLNVLIFGCGRYPGLIQELMFLFLAVIYWFILPYVNLHNKDQLANSWGQYREGIAASVVLRR